MGKYYSNNQNVVAGGSFTSGCDEAAAQKIGRAVAYDSITPGCWAVTGSKIIIADTMDSVQAGFERFNFNIASESTQPAVPNNFVLHMIGPLG